MPFRFLLWGRSGPSKRDRRAPRASGPRPGARAGREARADSVAPVAGLLQADEVVFERGEDGRAAAVRHGADKGVGADVAVARVFGDGADDPAEDGVVNRARAQFAQPA